MKTLTASNIASHIAQHKRHSQKASGPKKLPREELIRRLVQALYAREPNMRGYEEDARYRVTHTVVGKLDRVRDIALSARVRGLITEDEFRAYWPEG